MSNLTNNLQPGSTPQKKTLKQKLVSIDADSAIDKQQNITLKINSVHIWA
jgi:hypothetical protein